MKTKFLVFFIGLSLLVSFNFVQAQVTAITPDLEALAQTLHQQIEDLKERILQLQEELKQITTELKEAEKTFKFTRNLRKGLRNKEVEYLQEFLSEYPEIYPEGLVTGYFGPLTEEAVKKFQEKHSEDILKPYGLNKGTGFVGEKTIAKINEILAEGAGASGQVPPGLTTAPGIQKKVATTTAPSSEEKITICHYPPDNPDARHTIVIDKSALRAHLKHGDTIGPCEELEPEPEPVPPGVKCTDSDGGLNYYVKGTVTLLDPYESKTDSCTYCTGACHPDLPQEQCVVQCGAVVEYYCENNGITSETYLCPNGCQDGVCLSVDTTPPVISMFQPSGTITDFTPTLSLNTDENATCRYIIGSIDHPTLPKCTTEHAVLCIPDQSFDMMPNTFSGAGTTYHYAVLETMAAGTYTYYARCQDTAGNKNTDSASITFTIASELPPEPEPEPEPWPDITPPAEITNFTATVGDSQAAFSWTNPSDADFAGTMIVRKTGGYPTSITDGTQLYDGTGTSYAEIGLTNGTTYYYKAFTHDEVPNFSSGAEVSATPTAAPLPPTPPVISNYIRTPSGSEILSSGEEYTHVRISYDVSDTVIACIESYDIGSLACYEENGCDADHGYFVAPLVVGENTISIDCWDAQGRHATHTDVVNVVEEPSYLTCPGQGGKFCSSKTPTEMCNGSWFDTNGCCIGDCYIPEDNNCYDSDGGTNYYVKGYVETQATKFVKLDNNLGRLYDACYGDMLREYTCEENYHAYAHITNVEGVIVDVDHTYTCPNGCQDGACLPADTTPPGE